MENENRQQLQNLTANGKIEKERVTSCQVKKRQGRA